MMNNRFIKAEVKTKGFMLIEAVLAVTLISAGTLLKIQYDNKQNELDTAKNVGSHFANILSAIDNRVVYDGFIKKNGVWAQNWATTESAFNIAAEEFIGVDYAGCEGNWLPEHDNNRPLALINCGDFSQNNNQLRFEWKIERTSHRSYTDPNGDILGDWRFIAYHGDEANFKKHFKKYPAILQTAQAQSSFSAAGLKSINYINIHDDAIMTAADCFQSGYGMCGIELKYENLIHKQPYLRTDGTTPAEGGITFRVNSDAETFKCKRIEDGVQREVECGLSFDESGDVYAALNSASVGNLILQERVGNSRTAAPVMCVDQGTGAEEFCGLTVVENNGAAQARAHFDAVSSAEMYANRIETTDLSVSGEATVENLLVTNIFETNTVTASDITTGKLAVDEIRAADGDEERTVKIFSRTVAHDDFEVKGRAELNELVMSGDAVEGQDCRDSALHLDGVDRLAGGSAGTLRCIDTPSGLRWNKAYDFASKVITAGNINLVGGLTYNFPAEAQGAKVVMVDGMAVPTGTAVTHTETKLLGLHSANCDPIPFTFSCEITVSDSQITGCSHHREVLVGVGWTLGGDGCRYGYETHSSSSQVKGRISFLM